MQFNTKLPQITVGEENQGPSGPIKKNKKWPIIYFMELPQVMSPREGLINPAQFVTELAVTKEMILVAAKSGKGAAYWSKERKRWLLVGKAAFAVDLPSFCLPHSEVKKLGNRQCDYAAVSQLLA